MSWNECRVVIGRSTADGGMSTSLFDLGVLKNQTATLTYTAGDELVAKASGGIIVARERLEGTWQLKFSIIEMDLNVYSYLLGKSGVDTTDALGHSKALGVNSGLVNERYSVIITPKNTDAVGFYASLADVSIVPSISETDGMNVELTFDIVKDKDGNFLTWFHTKTTDRTKVYPTDPYVADGTKPAPTSNTLSSKSSMSGDSGSK